MKKLLLAVFCTFFIFSLTHAQKIWNGSNITVTKVNFDNIDSLSAQDRITDSVWITRANRRGIFNRVKEAAYVRNLSPDDTEWAFGTLANYKTLSFDDWETTVASNPPGMVNRDMVLHLISDSIYLSIKFTQWTQSGQGGGFSYVRSTCESSSTINDTACGTYTSPGGKKWSQPGTYKDTIQNVNGCDSLMTINLTLVNYRTFKIRVCESYTSPSGKYVWKQSGRFMDTLSGRSYCGADSILTIDLTVTPITRISDTFSVCDSYITPSGSKIYTVSGVYNDTIRTGLCDSIFTYHLTVNKSKTSNITETSCDSYTSPSGRYTWTNTGNYRDTLLTTTGCDSVLLIDLTINRSQSQTINETACDAYTSPSGNFNWTQSGTYRDTLSNQNGCDSVLVINLTVLNSTQATLDVTECGTSYLSPSGNYTWTVNGQYQDTINNAVGCDSILTINLTFGQPSTATISPTVCKTYTSPSGIVTTTSSGTFNDTIINAVGCDSIITINLTVNNADATFQKQGNNLVANASGATYQWLNCVGSNFTIIPGATNALYQVTQTGNYALIVTENNCTDTSICLAINNLNIEGANTNTTISILPNPNRGQFSIRYEGSQDIQSLKIYGMNGQLYMSKEALNLSSGGELILETSLPAGFYFITLMDNTGQLSIQKLVIE